MERSAEAVLQQALALPETERADIAGALLESLEHSPDAEIEAAWRREVVSRVVARDAGKVVTVPWQEIREGLFARLRERRSG